MTDMPEVIHNEPPANQTYLFMLLSLSRVSIPQKIKNMGYIRGYVFDVKGKTYLAMAENDKVAKS